MTEREPQIDIDGAWRRFEQRAQGTKPAAVWLERGEAPAQAEQAERPIGSSTIKETMHMEQPNGSEGKRKLMNIRFRPWLAAALVAGLTIGLFTTSLGDKALAAMLQTFRVQHLAGVAIDQNDWDQLRQALQQSGLSEKELNLDKFGTVSTTGGGKPQHMTAAEAAQTIGAPVKLLPGQSAGQQVDALVVPQTQFTLRLHVDEVNRVLKRLGAKTMFPAGVDGQPIVGTLPLSVQVSDRSDLEGSRKMRTLIQMKQPRLDVPSGIDVEQVRKAVLDLPFLPEDVRRKLEGAQDWRQTLFVPTNGKFGTAQIAGREVLYTEQQDWRSAIWLDGDWLYVLNGAYESRDALLRDVKEIVGS